MSLSRFFIAMILFATPLRAQVIISEFLASNSNSIMDEDGEHEDWIEIRNGGASAVSLLGWYLTDNSNQPRKWAFPSRTLNAGSFLVVFASNKDRTPGSGNLHTNFKLSADPGYLALTQDIAGGGVQVVQAFNQYPQQATDVAYGASVVVTNTALIASGAVAKTLVPTVGNGGSSLADTWKGAAANEPFNDAAWTAGTTAVGFANAGVATTNLKLRLNANDGATLVTDTSGAGHNGTNNLATWVAEEADLAGKTRHGTLQFNATDANGAATGDQVIVPAHADYNGTTGTIMFWIKTAGNVADGGNVEGAMLFDRRVGTSSGQGLILYLTDAGNLRIQPRTSGGATPNTLSSTATVKDDQWHHVALIFSVTNGEACTFYIDGVASGTGNNTETWAFTTTQQIEIGRSHDPFWRRFNGQFDDMRFYNVALTPEQIQSIYSNEDEPVTPGTNVLAAMQNVNPSAFVRVPFNVADPGAFTALKLTMKWNDGYAAWLNGAPIGSFASPEPLAYDSAATQSHSAGAPFVSVPQASQLRAGQNILAIQALNDTATNGAFSVLPQLDGINAVISATGYLTSPTPGAANSAAKTNVGPFISNVTKKPDPRPTGTAASPPLTINATVVPSLRPLAASNPVQLKYVVMFGAEQTVNMTLTATPNVYTAQIPTATLGAGQMLRWRVVASDNTAVIGTAPEYSDPLDNERYYGTVAVDSSIQTSLPVLYWFTPSSTAADNQTGTRNSFFFKAPGDTGVGDFYDNVEINVHGQSSSGFTKKSYDLDFNEDNRFEFDAVQKKVKDINLLTNWGDKSKTHNQMTHEAFATIGSAAHWCYQVRVQQVTPANALTPASHFWSIADMLEDGDDLWMDRIGKDPNGALYKIYDSLSSSSSAEKKTRTFEGKSDLDALIAALNVGNSLPARRQYAYDNLDLPQCVSYFVGCIITSHQDHGHKNFYMYRDTPGTREWAALPWDVDLTWGRDWLDASGYFTDTIFTNNELDMYN
ncbi:MAG TPA: LamG-like jellyroll fold domain-containing protein, partial [Chthoniobacteraceae bacterium]|nr:LamG-like jellyroll fold domain-containing protein [Chthoniobacteraceae bacterium]